jgi:hypothetical protein
MSITTTSTSSWNPSKAEVAAIVAELRPVIDRFVDRDRRRMAAWAEAA